MGKLKPLKDWEIQQNLPVEWTKDNLTDTHDLIFYVGSLEEPTNPLKKVYCAKREGLTGSSRTFTLGNGEQGVEMPRVMAQRYLGGTANYWIEMITYDATGKKKKTETLSGRIVTPGRNTSYPPENGYQTLNSTPITIARSSALWDTVITLRNVKDEILFQYDERVNPRKDSHSTVIAAKHIATTAFSTTVYLQIESYYRDKRNSREYKIRDRMIEKAVLLTRRGMLWSETVKPTFHNTNQKSIDFLGNDDLLEGYSNLRIVLPSGMFTARDGASFKELRVQILKQEGFEEFNEVYDEELDEWVYSDYLYETVLTGTFPKTLNLTEAQFSPFSGIHEVLFTAVDTQLGESSKTFSFDVIPYTGVLLAPLDVSRMNGYEDNLVAAITGSYSPIYVKNAETGEYFDKNKIGFSLKYRRAYNYGEYLAGKEEGVQVAIRWEASKERFFSIEKDEETKTFRTNTLVTGFVGRVGEPTLEDKEEKTYYEIEIWAKELFSGGDEYHLLERKIIGPGEPLVYFDRLKKSVGFGVFPELGDMFETALHIRGHNGLDLTPADPEANPFEAAITLGTDENYEGVSFGHDGRDYVFGYDKRPFHTRSLRIDSGSISITPSAGNVATKASIEFNLPFDSPPEVVTSSSTTVPGVTVTGHSASAITEIGCDIYLTRTNTTPTTVKWLAIWRDEEVYEIENRD